MTKGTKTKKNTKMKTKKNTKMKTKKNTNIKRKTKHAKPNKNNASKKILKRKYTRSRRHVGGDEPKPMTEFQKEIRGRDNFRKMFNEMFGIIYSAQEQNNVAAYEKGIIDFIGTKTTKGALERYKNSINTLIPITTNYMPIDKPTYRQDTTPLMGFVPFMSIMIYHLKNEKDIIRMLTQFRRNSGNINLTSIKYNITALSTAVELGKMNVINDLLLYRKADRNTLSDANNALLSALLAKQEEALAVARQQEEVKKQEELALAVVRQQEEEAARRQQEQEAVSRQQEQEAAEQTQPSADTADKEESLQPTQPSADKAASRQQEENIQPSADKAVSRLGRLNYKIPIPKSTGYPDDPDNPTIPEFWKPIFNKSESELLDLRTRIKDIMTQDTSIELVGNKIKDTWTICKIVQTMIPSYYVQTTNEVYTQRGIIYNDLNIDFTHYNMMLCACLILYGILSDRMVGEKYSLLLKGGKAIQLVLAQIPNINQYTSEDIDIMVKPNDDKSYDRDEIKNLASHIGYLLKWFLSSPTLKTNISVLLPPTEPNAKTNPNIVKLSYEKIVKRPNYRTGTQDSVYKALSDIDFKELPAELAPYFNQVHKYEFYIEELQTDVLFVSPHMGALIDEKLYFYSKYMKYKILLEKGKKITDPTYENVTIDECDYFLNKFSKAIKGLTYGLEQQRNPDLVGDMLLDKQKKFLSQRLDKFNVIGETKARLLSSLV
jgi:phage terminase small subunit